jgi:CRISPR-associated protein Csm1
MSQLLDASCRVAIAALLHDLGKFAERARIPEAEEKDADGNSRRDLNVQLYCPEFQGRRTHIHAAYTAIAFDLLEQHFPELVGENMTPFAPWRDKDVDDSIINAAASHHKPSTFLQRVVATADRLASGFEREEFERYNAAEEETSTKKNHYTARQLSLLEQIRLDSGRDERTDWRYPLKPLSPESIFPCKADGYEHDDRNRAQEEYLTLWKQFIAGLDAIPSSHRRQLPLWLDHFESCWLTFTHAIPAATAFNVKPEVSLYDHAKAVAALALALWRWHLDRGQTDNAGEELRAMWDRERQSGDDARAGWENEKFLLVQGDFFGIQDFIFAAGGETNRQAAKLLRGRSFYVSLLTECAALKVLEALDLPSTSQVLNAAGKFLIVAPNTEAAVAKLREIQDELDRWFLDHTYGQSGIGLAWLAASSRDFRQGKDKEFPFSALMKRLFEQLEVAKLRRFKLCSDGAPPAAFNGYLDQFHNTHGACDIDGRSPAVVRLDGDRDIWLSRLAKDHVDVGKWLAEADRVLITRNDLAHRTLHIPLFGYWVSFSGDEETTGKFGKEADSGNLVRAWDFSLPASGDESLWHGYARRHINGYIARFGDAQAYDYDRYQGLDEPSEGDPKTLNHLALDDRNRDPEKPDRWIGVEALMTLKGDVDDLGLIFQKGLERPTFAKMAALSRQVNAFFAIWLPWVCQEKFPNTYTVFAGGDDFFLIGPWRSMIGLGQEMRKEFRRYVAENSEIHFSAGLSMTKPGLPVRHLGEMAEDSLEKAKGFAGNGVRKNAVACYDEVVSWDTFDSLLMKCQASLAELARKVGLSTGYLYDLLRFTEMAGKANNPAIEINEQVKSTIWHSRFAYSTRRLVETKVRRAASREELERERRRLHEELASAIASEGIERHGAAYKIALFTYLYQQRD